MDLTLESVPAEKGDWEIGNLVSFYSSEVMWGWKMKMKLENNNLEMRFDWIKRLANDELDYS